MRGRGSPLQVTALSRPVRRCVVGCCQSSSWNLPFRSLFVRRVSLLVKFIQVALHIQPAHTTPNRWPEGTYLPSAPATSILQPTKPWQGLGELPVWADGQRPVNDQLENSRSNLGMGDIHRSMYQLQVGTRTRGRGRQLSLKIAD